MASPPSYTNSSKPNSSYLIKKQHSQDAQEAICRRYITLPGTILVDLDVPLLSSPPSFFILWQTYLNVPILTVLCHVW